jgi:hypothetical protein
LIVLISPLSSQIQYFWFSFPDHGHFAHSSSGTAAGFE